MSGLQFVGLFGSGGGEQKTCYVEAVTSSGLWTVPAGVTGVDVCIVPGGTSGGNASGSQVPSVQRGNGGKPLIVHGIPVTPTESIPCTIGAGGAGEGSANATVAKNGGNSSFGEHVALGTETVDTAQTIFPNFDFIWVSGRGVGMPPTGSAIPRAGAGVGGGIAEPGPFRSALGAEPNTGSGGGNAGTYVSSGASGIIYIRYYK